MKLIKTLTICAFMLTAAGSVNAQENNMLMGELVPPTTLALGITGIIIVGVLGGSTSTSSTN